MTRSKFDYKSIIKAVGAFFLTWLGEKILDGLGVFDKIKLLFAQNETNKILQFFNRPYSLWQIILISILLFLSYKSMTILTRQNKAKKVQKRQDEFKGKVEFIKIPGHELTVKTKLTFDTNNNLQLTEIYPYRSKHGEPPVKMVQEYLRFTCPVGMCNHSIDNSNLVNALERLEHLLVTELEQKWRMFKDLD